MTHCSACRAVFDPDLWPQCPGCGDVPSAALAPRQCMADREIFARLLAAALTSGETFDLADYRARAAMDRVNELYPKEKP